MQTFQANRGKVPLEELDKFRGKYVAWSPDGTRILGGDEDIIRLDRLIRDAGYDPADTLVSMVPSVDTILGGGTEGSGSPTWPCR